METPHRQGIPAGGGRGWGEGMKIITGKTRGIIRVVITIDWLYWTCFISQSLQVRGIWLYYQLPIVTIGRWYTALLISYLQSLNIGKSII